MLTKIINEDTKECLIVNQVEAAKSPDMTEIDVEQGYDGKIYVKGHAPGKSGEAKRASVRAARNRLLRETDLYMIADFPVTEEKREKYRSYRRFLRDYTQIAGWFDQEPAPFEEWEKE